MVLGVQRIISRIGKVSVQGKQNPPFVMVILHYLFIWFLLQCNFADMHGIKVFW